MFYRFTVLFLLALLISVTAHAQGGITVGNGSTLTINPGGLFANLNCQNLTIANGGTLIVNSADLMNVTNFVVEPGGTVQFVGASSIDVATWTNNSTVNGIPDFAFNGCAANSVSGTGDTDGDGIPDGEESCTSDPNGGSTPPFLVAGMDCSTAPEEIPVMGPIFNILMALSLLMIVRTLTRTRGRLSREK